MLPKLEACAAALSRRRRTRPDRRGGTLVTRVSDGLLRARRGRAPADLSRRARSRSCAGPAARSGTSRARRTSTWSPASRCARSVTGIRRRSQALADAGVPPRPRLEPVLVGARRSRSPSGCTTLAGFGRVVLLQLGRRGDRGAIKLATAARRRPRRRRRSTRSCASSARSTGARSATLGRRRQRCEARPVRAGARRLPARAGATIATRCGRPSGRRPRRCCIEPVQGEGGVWPLTPEFLAEARALCDEHDALLVLDEVQTGIGSAAARGSAFQRLGVRPDAIALPRASASGLPIGALRRRRGRRRLRARRPRDDVRRQSADRRRRAGGARRDRARGPRRERRARSARTSPSAPRRSPGVAEVRGHGLLLAVELASAALGGRRRPRCASEGVLVNAITPTALRLCPALGLARGEADLFCAALADVLGNVYATSPV